MKERSLFFKKGETARVKYRKGYFFLLPKMLPASRTLGAGRMIPAARLEVEGKGKVDCTYWINISEFSELLGVEPKYILAYIGIILGTQFRFDSAEVGHRQAQLQGNYLCDIAFVHFLHNFMMNYVLCPNCDDWAMQLVKTEQEYPMVNPLIRTSVSRRCAACQLTLPLPPKTPSRYCAFLEENL